MKTEYIETIPIQKIKHKLVVCDNCENVIIDNGEEIETRWQIGDKDGKLMDFCSEKCMRKWEVKNGLRTKNYQIKNPIK